METSITLISAALACSAVTLSAACAWLLRPARSAPRHSGASRSAAGDVAVVALAAAPAALLIALRMSAAVIWVCAAICAAASLVWIRRTRRWTIAAHLAWSSATAAGAAFLAYAGLWTLAAHLTIPGRLGGGALWLLEAAAYLLSLAYLWELIDAVGSRGWLRRLPDGADLVARSEGPFPFVSLHVPAHNEPPEMVIETIRSLLSLDYPDFEVVVLDNNTAEDALWQPVAEFCAQQAPRVTFHRLVDWPGYKSGALNFGLTVTDPRAEIIAVVDSDYIVEPSWLRATVPMFADRDVAFVQSPQDYRGWEGSRYYRRLYHSYDYFFRVSQRSRDERDAAIFGGTMGLVRRSALLAVGGWSEWCITEDAELSLRLHKAGWSGRHIDASFGRGIMPLTFEALKGQRFRWCFGGVQILRLHWRSLMPWNRDQDNHLTRSQRLGYLVGALQWFGDLLSLGFLAILLLPALDAALGGTLVLRRLSPLLLVAIPALLLMALARAIAGIRRVGGATWAEAAGALGIWLGLRLTVARACVRGLVEQHGVFLRTPKTRAQTSLRESMRMNRSETAIAAVCVATAGLSVLRAAAAGTVLVSALLLMAGASYLLAPLNSFASLRADLPARMRRRRASERMRAWRTSDNLEPHRRAAWLALAGGVAALALVAFAPATSTDSPDAAPKLGNQGAVTGPQPATSASAPSSIPGIPSEAPSPSASTTTGTDASVPAPSPSDAPVADVAATPAATPDAAGAAEPPTSTPTATPSSAPATPSLDTQPAAQAPAPAPGSTLTTIPSHDPATPSRKPSALPTPSHP